MSLQASVVEAVESLPRVRRVTLAGSRADGREHPSSDWDFAVETDDFGVTRDELPGPLEPLRPLAAQWDRLSENECFMLILPGPVKVDLIFAEEPHRAEPPWSPDAGNLPSIDRHFWDWMLWLAGKAAARKASLVADELTKLSQHLLRPLGAPGVPASIPDAVAVYRAAREEAERRFDVRVPRFLEAEVAPALPS